MVIYVQFQGTGAMTVLNIAFIPPISIG